MGGKNVEPIGQCGTPLVGYLALKLQDFAHPREVVLDQDLDAVEKRAILAAWASDASAVESRPEFRWLFGTPGPVLLSHVLAALRSLDLETEQEAAFIAARSHAPDSMEVVQFESPTLKWTTIDAVAEKMMVSFARLAPKT
jgi:hypothetical protein